MTVVTDYKTEKSQQVQIFDLCKSNLVSLRGIFWNTLLSDFKALDSKVEELSADVISFKEK